MSTPKDSDGLPDFSFLGDDAVPDNAVPDDSPGQFDFSEVEQDTDSVPDAPVESEGDSNAFDFPKDADSPVNADVPPMDAPYDGPEMDVPTDGPPEFDGPGGAEAPPEFIAPPVEPASPAAPVPPKPATPEPSRKRAVRRLTPKVRQAKPVEPPPEANAVEEESPFEPDDTNFGDAASAFEVYDSSAQADESPGDKTNNTLSSNESSVAPSDAEDPSQEAAAASVVAAAASANDVVSKKTFSMVAGYAAALTLLLITLVATGRLTLTGPSPLESLPDVAPLREGEFRKVLEATDVGSLPPGHALELGQSQRFGDVIFTPVKVTREPLRFLSMLSGAEDKTMATGPVLKLWFKLQNASSEMAFPAWDVSLMSHRHPAEGTDSETAANSWLMVQQGGEEKRILNYLHSPSSSFDLLDQNSRKIIEPGDEITTFIACSDQIAHVQVADGYRWRLQLRKGVNSASGNGVTTLVDVTFDQSDVGS